MTSSLRLVLVNDTWSFQNQYTPPSTTVAVCPMSVATYRAEDDPAARDTIPSLDVYFPMMPVQLSPDPDVSKTAFTCFVVAYLSTTVGLLMLVMVSPAPALLTYHASKLRPRLAMALCCPCMHRGGLDASYAFATRSRYRNGSESASATDALRGFSGKRKNEGLTGMMTLILGSNVMMKW